MMRNNDRQVAADLLNFHFASPPPSQQHSQQTTTPRGPSRNQPQYRRRKEDRSSARRKVNAKMFYLHSSPDHAFIITRRPLKGQQYSFQGPDEPVPWECVRIVKVLTNEEQTCPICLDNLICPRITSCGHVYCLTCIIRHVHAHAANYPYDTNGPKCPCCGMLLHLSDVKCVEFVITVPTAIHQNIRLVKLHRAKACPAPFLPLPHRPRRSSPRAAPCQTDADAPYCRFNYVDPGIYQALLERNQSDLIQASDDVDTVIQCTALDFVQRQIVAAAEEAAEEFDLKERFAGSAAGIYQKQPSQLMAENYQKYMQPNESIESQQRRRGDSIHSLDSAASSTAIDVISSMYLDNEDVALYQAEDGKMVFLSKFNMACLRAEYSPNVPDLELVESTTLHPHRTMPLPDTVEGKILEIEQVHLSQEVRQKLRFLSHIPIFTDICFVEISLNGLLSNETKKLFRKDFMKRKQARVSRINAEKRADDRAKQLEEERVKELKARFQRIDPNDDFFRPMPEAQPIFTGEEFGPSVRSNAESSIPVSVPMSPGLSFSEITRSGGAFPPLRPDDRTFPALGSSAPQAVPSSWGRVAISSNHLVSPADTATKKKSKGKKIVLFSTGSQRGG